MAQTPALESIFANAEQSAQSMVAAATTGINSKINTIEAAEQLVATLSNEAAKFNQHLLAISNAMHQLEIGDISQEEARATIVPCVQALKGTCSALKFADVQMSDSDDITEEEIAILRELIIGTKAAADARLVALKTSATPGQISTEGSGVLASMAGMTPAEEGLFGGPTGKLMNSIRNSTEAKTAKSMYGNAKKMWGYGQKEKAKEYLLKAQALYEKCLKKVMESGHFKTTTNTTTTTKQSVGGNTSHAQVSKDRTTSSKQALAARNYFEDRIDSCKALMQQWENKTGNATYSETKAQLKKERSEARKAQREAKKNKNGGNDSMNPVSESFIGFDGEFDMTTTAYLQAMEAALDELEVTEFTAALEADDGGEGAEASSKGGKIRALLAKFKKEKSEGDESAASATANEIDSTMSEIESDAEQASSPEEKKKAGTAVKIAVGAVAAAAVALGAVAASKDLKSEHSKLKGIGQMANGLFDKLKKKPAEQAASGEAKTAKGLWAKIKGIKLPKIGKKDTAAAPAEGAAESYSMLCGETNLDPAVESYVMALEASLDVLGMDEYTSALESEGSEEGAAGEAKGSRFRALLAKFKKAKKDGNESEANSAAGEAEQALAETEAEADQASTPEANKKSNKRLLIIVGAVAAAAAVIFVGKKTDVLGKIKTWHEKSKNEITKNPDKPHKNIFKEAKAWLKQMRLAKLERKHQEASDQAYGSEFNKKAFDRMNKLGEKIDKLKAHESFADLMIALSGGATPATEGAGCTECDDEALEAEADEMVAQMLAEDGYDD
ncbi:MAG: hypothetical protein NC548_05660 [Lachnospiraceae bacterium]|nr:hypothetical protein [Lachnospiraceae bacterium]